MKKNIDRMLKSSLRSEMKYSSYLLYKVEIKRRPGTVPACMHIDYRPVTSGSCEVVANFDFKVDLQ